MARMRSNPSSRGSAPQEAVARAGEQAFRLRLFGETLAELRRVTWPSREQVARLTVLTLSISVAVGIFLGAVDWVFSQLARLILF